jgi:hypothetical protein
MSSIADIDDTVEVSADGLTVRKRFAAEFPVPAIRFEIESDHAEPVSFRLSEEIPELFPMDRIGFHPEYGSENWTAFQDNHIELAGTLEPDEPLETVYGIRIDEEEVGPEFLTEPVIEVHIDSPLESDEPAGDADLEDGAAEDADERVGPTVDGDDGTDVDALETNATTDAAASEVETAHGDDRTDETRSADLDHTAEGPAEGAVDPSAADLGFGDESGEAAAIDVDAVADASGDGDSGSVEIELDSADGVVSAPEPANDAGGTDDAEPAPEPDVRAEESVLARLVAELSEGDVEGELTRLRAELDIDESPSELARVDHLQLRVEEVAAYTNALEQFLDEEGTGRQLVDGLSSIEDRLDEAESRVDGLETDVDSIDGRATMLESDLDSVQQELTEIQEWRDQLGSMFTTE